MNRERIQQLIDLFETLPDSKVNMSVVFQHADGTTSPAIIPIAELQHGCGTAACIAGWAESLFGMSASRALELDPAIDGLLYMPRGWMSPGRYTRLDAIETLKRLLETGEVRWPEKVTP